MNTNDSFSMISTQITAKKFPEILYQGVYLGATRAVPLGSGGEGLHFIKAPQSTAGASSDHVRTGWLTIRSWWWGQFWYRLLFIKASKAAACTVNQLIVRTGWSVTHDHGTFNWLAILTQAVLTNVRLVWKEIFTVCYWGTIFVCTRRICRSFH